MDFAIDWGIPALFLGGLFYFYRKEKEPDIAPIMILLAAIFWPVTLAYFLIEFWKWMRI